MVSDMGVWDAFKFAFNVYMLMTVITVLVWIMIVIIGRFTKKG
jgi:hypothetical protein